MEIKKLNELEKKYEDGFKKWFEELKEELNTMDVRQSIVEQVYKNMGCGATEYSGKEVIIDFIEGDYIFCSYDIEKKLYEFTRNDVSKKYFDYVSIVMDHLTEKGVL